MRLPIRALLLVALVATLATIMACTRTPGQPLTVMSFNIRYGTANDGENRWEARRDLLMEVIREANPDVLGLQEALRFQIDEILATFSEYRLLGVGRDDGREKGEYAAVLYRASRFRVGDSGTFWFSDRPDEPGSVSWGNTIPRICTWAQLRDSDGRTVAVFNVHLDHRSQPSRQRSVQTLAARLAEEPDDRPVIVMGDFNAGEDNPAIAYLLGRAASAVSDGPEAPPSPTLVDTFRVRHPSATEVGTFTGFELGRTAGPKIDHIFVDPRIEVLEAAIVRTRRDDRYPSDHFPVTARVAVP